MRSRSSFTSGLLLGLTLALSPTVALATTFNVATDAELETAIQGAAAGDEIVLADGIYSSTGISCASSGTEQSPILVRAATPLGAEVRFDAVEGFHVTGDNWHFEDLRVTGVCADDSACEHAFHVAGASGFVMRRVTAVDFNAQLKVNSAQSGASWTLPQKGLVEGCDLHDTRARNTANPVTKLDMDSGDDWIVRGNIIHDFQKGQGDNVSYAAFLKCGGMRGLMEQNLVLCERDFAGGTRIGLSLGGGGCAPQFCEPSFDAGTPCVEHHDGIVRNNIIAQCSDVGVYVNASANSHVFYNTLIGTAGIDFRFAPTTGLAAGNLLAGKVRNRDGATGQFSQNLEDVTQTTFDGWYMAPLVGDLRKMGDQSALLGQGTAVAEVPDDYCARTRSQAYDLGALQASLGDCDTTQPPVTASSTGTGASTGTAPQTGTGSGPGAGGAASSGSGGAGAASNGSSGCGCRVAEEPPAGTLIAMVLAATALAVSRRAKSLRPK